MKSGRILMTAAVLLGLAVAVAPGRAGPAPRAVQIKARDFAFDPKELSVRAGEVVFEVKNEGSIEHNFVIEDANRRAIAQIPVIEAGKTEDLKVTLRAGTFTIVCTLPGHKEVGMHAALRVQP